MHKTAGVAGGASCLGIALLVIVLTVACGVVGGIPAASMIDNKLAEDRARAEAQRARDDAAHERAEADRIESEAVAKALRDYSEVSQFALYADVRKAHPELFWRELLQIVVLGVLALVAAVGMFVAWRISLTPKNNTALVTTKWSIKEPNV